MDKEIMVVEENEVMEEETMNECGNSGFGKVLLGAGIVGAGVALFKLVPKVINKIKSKKEATIVVEAEPNNFSKDMPNDDNEENN